MQDLWEEQQRRQEQERTEGITARPPYLSTFAPEVTVDRSVSGPLPTAISSTTHRLPG